MAIKCTDNNKFRTTEARAKSILRTQGAIDKFLNILNLPLFRQRNKEWSNKAKEKYGIQENLFSEDQMTDRIKAVPNKEAFKTIDRAEGIYYQIGSKEEHPLDNIEEKLSGFQLYEDRNKLCSEGICNYTARKSTEKLKEAGLNPFPNITGSQLSVNVKSPVGDFNITHYVSAVAINGVIYIYDMPQHEFISNEFFGKIDTVDLKEKYKPRLIPLTIDEISANYNLSLEETGKFIYRILNTPQTNVNPSFRDYIASNIKNSSEYIDLLESEIRDSKYEEEKYETYEELNERFKKEKNSKLSKKLTKDEQNRVIKYFENKLKLKVREYLPKKTDKFRLVDLVHSIIGNRLFYGIGNSFDESLENLKRYLSSDNFIDELYNRVSSSKTLLDDTNSKINNVYRVQRMFLHFIKNVKVYGIKETLNTYNKNDQYEIRRLLPKDILDKYKSNSQAALMLGRYWSNRDNVVKSLEYGKSYEELVTTRFKNHAVYNKYNTVLNYLKSVDFNSSYLYNIISNEAQRRYIYFERVGNPQYQLEEVPVSTASSETLNKVKKVIEKMGISIQNLNDYLKGNPNVNAKGVNALADLMRGIIAIAEGKEDVALTEEMVHVATAILEQINPQMVTQMIGKIGNFKIYQQVFDVYSKKKNYQTPNGKPDIRKIKKEAVDKLIAEVIINQNEGTTEFPELMEEVNRTEVRTWWQRILDVFRSLYKKSDIKLFEEVAQQIMEGEQQTVEGLEGTFYQLSDKQLEFQRKVQETRNNIRKVESSEPVDPMLMDTDEGNNWYELISTGRRITKRVTDRVKSWYRSKFPEKDFTQEEKELNEFKRKHGVKGHKFLEEIHRRFYNDDGTKRETPDRRPVLTDPVDKEIYLKLENYYVSLIDRFSKEGKTPLVFSEVMLYDPKNDEAGTLDLLIVEEDGKAHIFDWKFMAVSKDARDIPWYKQGAFNIQLARYKDILIKNYGINSIGMNRAIPILFDIKYKNKLVAGSRNELKGIGIGSTDPREITELIFMPVSEETESVETVLEGEEGYEKIDKLIKKLNSILIQAAKKIATDEEEREFKIEKLNTIRAAVRALQSSANLTPLIDVISLMSREGQMLINDWNTIFKDKPSGYKGFTNEQLSEFAERIREYKSIAGVFRTIDRDLGKLIYSREDEDSGAYEDDEIEIRKNALEKIRREADIINESYEKIEALSNTFADRFIGLRNLVSGILDPKAIVRGLGATFRGVSDLPLPSLEILYKLVLDSKNKATQDALAEVDELMEIRKRIVERGNTREFVKKIYQKEEGKPINKLIYRYKKEFFDGIKDNALEGNRSKDWLTNNIDIEGYKTEAQELLNKRLERISRLYEGDDDTIADLSKQEKRKWDITRPDFNGWNNYLLKRHPLEKWESDEYKEVKRDADLFALYNFIHRMNDKAVENGYISNRVSSTFLPFVRKNMAESIAWDMSLSAVNNWSKELTLRAGDVGYGQVDAITGEYEYSIPKYYTYDFTKEDGSYDNVSEDIFKNMILYVSHMERYKYLSAIEEQIQLIKSIEKFKGHLSTAKNADVEFENGKPKELEGNEENARLFEVMMRALLYGHKYPLSSGDTPMAIGKALNFAKEGINRLAGRTVFPINEEASVTSLIKSIDAINRAFQLKTLGFEPVSGAVNAFGGNIQVATQAGNYFTAGEFIKNETMLLTNRFRSEEEREIFIQLNDLFMPMKDDPIYDRLKKSGLNPLTRGSFSDTIMFFMRNPELHLEKSVFVTLLQNTMIENGKMVNIREYVKNKYANRYASGNIYRESKIRMNQEIKELQQNRSIYAIKKLEDGKLVIPGLDLSDRDEIQRLTNLTRRISRNATGGLADFDINNMSLNVWTKSMMVFKNWIPKLIDTRFGEFRKVNDDFSVEVTDDEMTTGEKYDIGRIRLFFGLLGESIRGKGNVILNILNMNDKGIESLSQLYDKYAERFEKQNGKPLKLTREEFNDLISNNLRNQMKEFTMLLSLMASSIALGLIGPDDENNKAGKNLHRYTQRVFDRFIQELSFFYNPIEFQKMLSGSMFPAIGLISDAMRASDHFVMQVTGYDFGNHELTPDEVREKAQPIKNVARMFPGTKAAITWGAITSDWFAEEFDVTIQKETRR